MFKMIVESDWERARAATLWTKEPETIAWIKGFAENGIFWDIGANIGIYSLYCAQKHPNLTIFAFEPHKANFIRLWQNVLLNNFINITACYYALGAARSPTRFDTTDLTVGTSGGQTGPHDGYPIPMADGDWMAKRIGSTPTYIKIDTDNNEYDILCGLAETLSDPVLKSVLVEINDHEAEIIDMMDAAGFTVDTKLMYLIDRKHDHNVIFSR